MKYLFAIAAALMAASSLVPNLAIAQETGGNVCGRVLAPSDVTTSLSTSILQTGIVIARSGTETVQTTIGYNGSYCFTGLHPDLHLITAFGDEGGYRATITPIAGQTLRLDIYGPDSVQGAQAPVDGAQW